MSEIIGRVAATEKFPATMDKFYFWTDADFRLNAFDVVKFPPKRFCICFKEKP